MKRSRSPLSDNTIRKLAESEYLSDDFLSEISNVESSSEIDDTDSDPDYDPSLDIDMDQPSTSGMQRNLDRVLSNSDDGNNPSFTRNVTSTPKPRGRPRKQRPSVDHVMSSSSSDSEDDRNIVWEEVTEEIDQEHNHTFSYQEMPGIKHCPPQNSPPISYFRLFFTTSLLETCMQFTNKYARQFIAEHSHRFSKHSRSKEWKPVTQHEILAFIAVLLNMGIKKQPTLASYWSTSSSQHIPWFSAMFTRNRFQSILTFFHMVDTSNLPKPGTRTYDPCARFQVLIEHSNRLAKHYFTPYMSLSVDESMIGTKNHTQLLQYIPKKHHRWGIKLWMLCDATTHYCINFFVYKGAKGTEKDLVSTKGLGFTVVTKLLEMGDFLNKGYHVYADNFFTSISLTQYLYSKNTFFTGTLRKTRKGIPPDMTSKFEVGQKKYLRANEMLMLGYREKKSQKSQVLLISTEAKAGSEMRTKKRGNQVKTTNKPEVIRKYNDNMGGVDVSDQMLYQYLDERRTLKFWKKVIFNIFGRMVLNSYILYKTNTSKPLTRLDFIISIIEDISKEWLQHKNGCRPISPNVSEEICADQQGGGDAVQNKYFEKLPNKKEKNCCVCSIRSTKAGGKRKKSTFQCKKCKKGLHTGCYPEHSC